MHLHSLQLSRLHRQNLVLRHSVPPFSLKFSRHCVLRDRTQCRALFCYENEEMKKKTKLIILFNILISRFWFRDKAGCYDPPLGSQSLQNSVQSGERNVLALGSPTLLQTE